MKLYTNTNTFHLMHNPLLHLWTITIYKCFDTPLLHTSVHDTFIILRCTHTVTYYMGVYTKTTFTIPECTHTLSLLGCTQTNFTILGCTHTLIILECTQISNTYIIYPYPLASTAVSYVYTIKTSYTWALVHPGIFW